MYRVKYQDDGIQENVFTWKNPRSDGFAGDVEEDVWLDYDMEHVHGY